MKYRVLEENEYVKFVLKNDLQNKLPMFNNRFVKENNNFDWMNSPEYMCKAECISVRKNSKSLVKIRNTTFNNNICFLFNLENNVAVEIKNDTISLEKAQILFIEYDLSEKNNIISIVNKNDFKIDIFKSEINY